MGSDAADGEVVLVQHRLRWLIGTAVLVVAVDQLTKQWALSTLDDGDIDLVWTLRFNLVFNEGAAFSTFSGFGPVLGILALVVVVALTRLGRGIDSRAGLVALGMVAGGALGNLADRALRDGEGVLGGAVVDFIDLQWWPVFNVADMAIVVGGILLGLLAWRGDVG